MRNPKALVVPFRFREGYPDEIVDQHTQLSLTLLDEMNLDYDLAENVIYPAQADKVWKDHSPINYDFLILLIPTWIEPVLVIRAVKPFSNKPMVVWGFGTFMHEGERVNLGSMPGAGVVKGSLRELGIQHEFIYQMPGSESINQKIKSKIEKIANVARAITLLEQSRIVTIGYLFGGMALGDMDLLKMRSIFGPEIVEMDSYSLIRRMEKLDTVDETFKQNIEFVNQHLSNSLINKTEKVTRMYSVLKQIVEENQAQALTLKCHFEISQEYGLTPCIPLSILGNSIVASCEADIPVVLTQLILHYLSGGEITTYADIHEITDERLLVAACGFAPAGICIGNKIICDLPSDNPQGLGATYGDYITNKNYLREGKLCMARILKDIDGGFTLHYANGSSIGDIGRVSELGAPQYPFTEVELENGIDRFAHDMGSHHYAFVYADLAEELALFCEMKNIRLLIN